MVWLVIAAAHDEAASWAGEQLAIAGLEPLIVVTDADLAGATWEHRLGVDGVSSRTTLSDGRVIDSREIQGTLNRLQQAPLTSLAVEDREYGFHEISALFVSWLASLPGPILNPPDTRGLAGAWRPPAEWALLAAKAGLSSTIVTIDTEIDRSTASDAWREWPRFAPVEEDVIVVGGAVFALEPLSESALIACRRLASLAHTPILGLFLSCATCGGTPEIAGVTPLPDLRAGGVELIGALVEELRGGRVAA